jgi:hypothetical protein
VSTLEHSAKALDKDLFSFLFKKEDLESFIEHSNTKGCHKVSTLIFSNSIRLSRDRLSKEKKENKQGIRRKAQIS